MNEYLFSDMKIGMREMFSVPVTEEMLSVFQKLSGDSNPLHMSPDYAKENGFKDKVVYGMLTSAFLSRLVGMYLPGRYCLLRQAELKFIRPVYAGNVLRVEGEVTALNGTVEQAELKVSMENEEHEIVLRGKVKVGFLKEQKDEGKQA